MFGICFYLNLGIFVLNLTKDILYRRANMSIYNIYLHIPIAWSSTLLLRLLLASLIRSIKLKYLRLTIHGHIAFIRLDRQRRIVLRVCSVFCLRLIRAHDVMIMVRMIVVVMIMIVIVIVRGCMSADAAKSARRTDRRVVLFEGCRRAWEDDSSWKSKKFFFYYSSSKTILSMFICSVVLVIST